MTPAKTTSQRVEKLRQEREALGLRIKVQRKYSETYISSTFLGIACCIFRA